MNKNIEINETVGLKDSVSIRMRSYLSIQHIQSAAFFTRCAFKIEKEYNGTFSEELFMQHRAYITSTIMLSVSFLEGTINELFSDIAGNHEASSTKFDTLTSNLIANMWKLEVPRTSHFNVLQKYQIALALAQKDQFDRGQQSYQDVNSMIKLRNNLVHFEPEWITCPAGDDFREEDIHKFEKQLFGKFQLNPLTGQGNPFYPDKCLSHGCAEWAVVSSLKFTDEFFLRMKLAPLYNHVREKLGTK